MIFTANWFIIMKYLKVRDRATILQPNHRDDSNNNVDDDDVNPGYRRQWYTSDTDDSHIDDGENDNNDDYDCPNFWRYNGKIMISMNSDEESRITLTTMTKMIFKEAMTHDD